MKLEAIVIPVSDADRAKEFYTKLGWRLDADRSAGTDFRHCPIDRHQLSSDSNYEEQT